MDIDRFSHLKSPVHCWDPRFKITGLATLIAVIAYLRDARQLALVFFVAVILVASTKLPWNFVVKALKIPVAFLLVMLPVLALTAGGETLCQWGPALVYQQGIQTGAVIGVRAVSIMLVFIALLGTTRLHTTMQALQCLRLPDKLVNLLLFTYRYIFLYIDEKERLRRAVRLRGFNSSGALLRLRTLAGLVVNLLVHSIGHSERITSAMHLRGFNGKFIGNRSFCASWKDAFKTAAVVAVCVMLLVLEAA